MSNRMLLNIRNLSYSFLDKNLFDNLNFSVKGGRLLALLGANGCGKSTILNLIAAADSANEPLQHDTSVRISGEVWLEPEAKLCYLPQNLRNDSRGPTPTKRLEPSLAGRESKLCEDFGLATCEEPDDLLSDGELQKCHLVAALLAESDIYLLDEPTNYLDIRGITALEEHLLHLKTSGKAIVLVTHDRALTDYVADESILITQEAVYRADGGASCVWSVKAEDVESRARRSKEIGKKIQQLQRDIRAKSGWAAAKERQLIGGGGSKGHISRLSKKMAKRARIAQRRAEQEMQKLEETRPFVPKKLNLAFPKYEVRNRQAFALKNVSFSYSGGNSAPLLRDVTLSASTRDKFCLMGANGSGKTTLLKLAQGMLRPDNGTSRLNRNVSGIYLAQGLAGFYKNEILIDNFRDTGCDETTIRRFLGGALIRKDKPRESVTNFSYGELMRAAIVKCILSRAEFLFLDEPTSHLDIESIHVLEELLADFPGGYLMISHDRSFVENVADHLYLLEEGYLRLA